MNIVYHPAAAKEIVKEAKFYESRQTGLGEIFLDAIDKALVKISEHPLIWKANGKGRS